MGSENLLTDVVGKMYQTSPSTVVLLTTTLVLTLTLIAKRLIRAAETAEGQVWLCGSQVILPEFRLPVSNSVYLNIYMLPMC